MTVFKQMLGSPSAVPGKAQAHAERHHIGPGALLLARLFPDMFPLLRQARIDRTQAFNDGLTPARFEVSVTREIIIHTGTPSE